MARQLRLELRDFKRPTASCAVSSARYDGHQKTTLLETEAEENGKGSSRTRVSREDAGNYGPFPPVVLSRKY